MARHCPFCAAEDSSSSSNSISCKNCGSFPMNARLADEISEGRLFADTRHLVACWLRNRKGDRKFRLPVFQSPEDVQAVIDQCPTLPRERLGALFRYLVAATPELGRSAKVPMADLIAASYSLSEIECNYLLHWLKNDELLSALGTADGKITCLIAPKGYDEFYEQALGYRLTVFVSSTCYDLLDLRFELAAFLESKGHSVKLSDDPDRFAVDPSDDSIETCLRNLEASDVVICIIDRRYGGVLKKGSHDGKSATHIEVLHARSLDPRKPVFFFMREKAWLDYGILKDNPAANVNWVEPRNPDNRNKWMEFVNYVSALPEHARSNWVTFFKSSVDLKGLVLKRLHDFAE
jgi:hypothetical protein